MRTRFWKAIALLAYRRWVKASPVKPTGIPGNRDPQAPCPGYEPRRKEIEDWGQCETDGHYLCQECCHISIKRTAELLNIDTGDQFGSFSDSEILTLLRRRKNV